MQPTWDRDSAPGDSYYRHIEAMQHQESAGHPMDSDAATEEHGRLMRWFYHERERQSDNRLEMSIDHDFYDGIQWNDEDAQVLLERGQMPLVFNEIAPMIDFVSGTQRRMRVDWNVLPRSEDDVKIAALKRDMLKYVGDINRIQYHRSEAFDDAIKGGIGWLDDGARNDPTQDVLYSRKEDWRCVLWDSFGHSYDGSDWRYLIRWRWLDDDVALAAFQNRQHAILRALEDRSPYDTEEGEDLYYTEQRASDGSGLGFGSMGIIEGQRRRLKVMEFQYRKPAKVRLIVSGKFKGAFIPDGDEHLEWMARRDRADIIERVTMRTHIAMCTERDMLAMGPSIYRHNKYSLTPVWCYRRTRDRLPYGLVRRVRDLQLDMNKRASKSLFLLNSRQVIADKGAVEDVDEARSEIDQPDGWIEKKANHELRIERDSEQARGQMEFMALDADKIETAGGVTDEAKGRTTNAISGKAIQARQNQSAVVLTKPFDYLRLAVQVSGEKQLSLAEQFYSDDKVIRITGARGKIEFRRLNQPEQQPDGTIRVLNDVTASMADFIVDEADYAGTVRQAMSETISEMAGRMAPEIAVRMLIVAMEFSDLPNKDELANEMRKVIGERDPDAELTPQEQQEMEAQKMLQAEAIAIQAEMARISLEEAKAKVREINAKAAKMEAEAGGDSLAREGAMAARGHADRLLEEAQNELRELRMKLLDKTAEIQSREDIAAMEADVKLRIAELNKESDGRFGALSQRVDKLASAIKGNGARNKEVQGA